LLLATIPEQQGRLPEEDIAARRRMKSRMSFSMRPPGSLSGRYAIAETDIEEGLRILRACFDDELT
jgi:hypothetical protein